MAVYCRYAVVVRSPYTGVPNGEIYFVRDANRAEQIKLDLLHDGSDASMHIVDGLGDEDIARIAGLPLEAP